MRRLPQTKHCDPSAHDVPIISSTRTELKLSRGHIVVVQRIGGVVRITTGHRVKRSVTSSIVLGGTVLLPIRNLPAVLREVRAAATDED